MDQFEQEIEIEAIGVEVSTQPIELYKVLKIADAVGGGGEAKQAISQGYVAVNGELETRKRRKLVDGDLIEFNEEFYVVIHVEGGMQSADEEAEFPVIDNQQPVTEVESFPRETRQAEPEAEKPAADKKTGRRSIDFF